jgi:hypothetical protein
VVSSKIKAAIEGLALERPPLPIRSICRQIQQFAEVTGERSPRCGTVYDLVREIPGGLLPSLTVAVKHIAKALIWFTDVRHQEQMRSGKQTMRS